VGQSDKRKKADALIQGIGTYIAGCLRSEVVLPVTATAIKPRRAISHYWNKKLIA